MSNQINAPSDSHFGIDFVLAQLRGINCGEATLWPGDPDPQVFEIRHGHIGEQSIGERLFVQALTRTIVQEGLLVVRNFGGEIPLSMAWHW